MPPPFAFGFETVSTPFRVGKRREEDGGTVRPSSVRGRSEGGTRETERNEEGRRRIRSIRRDPASVLAFSVSRRGFRRRGWTCCDLSDTSHPTRTHPSPQAPLRGSAFRSQRDDGSVAWIDIEGGNSRIRSRRREVWASDASREERIYERTSVSKGTGSTDEDEGSVRFRFFHLKQPCPGSSSRCDDGIGISNGSIRSESESRAFLVLLDAERIRFVEISRDGKAYAFRVPETWEDVEIDPSERWRRAWTKDGSSVTKLVLPASFCLSEGLQSRFKFLLGLMESMEEDYMKGIRIIDLSMNGLMLNFLLHSMYGLSELRVLDISGNFVQEDKLLEFLSSAVQCYALNISLLDMKRLPPRINIGMLRFLMLDNNPLIEAIPVDCFASLKYLERLSMCATGISDLWTTADGLSKLPVLKHVRFQRCSEEEFDGVFWDEPSENWEGKDHALMIWRRSAGGYHTWGEREANLLLSKYEMYPHYANAAEKESCNGEEDAIHQKVFETFLVRRQSPICLQKGYRQFLTLRLPNLVSLDGIRVGPLERAETSALEGVPRCGLSHVLGYREIGGLGPGCLPIPNTRKTRDMDGRMLCSQNLFHKVGSWPRIREICPSAEQPRQFEYHPTIPGIVAIGTADNHLMVHNWKKNLILGKEEMSISVGDHRWSSVLGISWLNQHPGLLLAGSDNGTIRLFDVSVLSAPDRCAIRGKHNFTRFPDLTSISINCSDAYFVTSGYSNDVALYETCTQKLVNVYKNLHSDHINVIRFSHHSPSLLATSSFDRDVKMWDLRTNMRTPILRVTSDAGNLTIGFSHNDQFLLSSATDNDVRQYLVSDGRLHTKLDIEPTGNCNNFTRSYYMADADYIITGSCEQPGARVCSARTGKVLRQVTFECEDYPRMIAGVQSLRADPLDDLKFAVLTSTEEHLPNSSKMLEVDMSSCFSGG